jgi:hypothetical protein
MKDPAVLFYTQDFLTGTMLMTYDQRGKYITLLCLQHQNGKLSEKDMLKICGEFDAEIWAKFTEADDFYYNERMLIEAEKRIKYTESRKKNLGKHAHMDAHMENENENKDKVSNIWDKWKEYKRAEFGFKYKSEVSEAAARKQLLKLSGGDMETAVQIVEQSISNGWKGLYELKRNGKHKGAGVTDAELAELMARKHGVDSPNRQH